MLFIYRTSGIVMLLVVTLISSAIAFDNLSTAESTTLIQTSSQKSTPVVLNSEYFTGYWTDTKNILTSPARWNSSDWLEASLIMGTAVGLYTQDDKIRTWVQKNKNTTTANLADDTKKIFSLSLPAVVGLGVYGYAASDDKAKTTFLLSTESFVITGVFVQVLKRSTGRHRPYTGDSHDTWSGPVLSGKSGYLSFPSGDPSTAFSIATVVATEYDNMFVPPLVYGISTLVALERVHNNAHWSSDVFVAAAIGYFTGKAVVASHAGNKDNTLSIAPMIDGNDKGVLITYRY
jgi:membrane-associated phospholipid phosphatase